MLWLVLHMIIARLLILGQVQQLRQCTRMLKLCRIEQADWHSKQILCGDAMTEQTPTFNYEMVLIDFGFAYQRLHGEDYGLPPTKDVFVPCIRGAYLIQGALQALAQLGLYGR